MIEENKKKADLLTLERTARALKANGFEAEIFNSASQATERIISIIEEGKKVGLGGSITAAQLGLPERIRGKNTLYTHLPEMSQEERRKVWLSCMDCDFYIASPQAVTADGKLIFIDGNGNRCAPITWGPRHILLPAGINKIARNLEEGLWRMRNISAIANNIRLNKKNPCVGSGKCEDCSSPERICNLVTQVWKKPRLTKYTVFLINEELGY
ncbi:MAG: lactate utilization protein [Elusimicrobiota bacterium]